MDEQDPLDPVAPPEPAGEAQPPKKRKDAWDGPGTYEYTGRTVREFQGAGQMVSVSPGQTFYLTVPVEGLSYRKVED